MKNTHLFLILSYLSVGSIFAFQKIDVKGNLKTSTKLIVNQSKLENKNSIKQSDINIAKRRLLNMGLFSSVMIKKTINGASIHVQERWTTIPILKFSSGGGVGQATVGLFDPNIAGRYIEAGGQYTRLDETNSGVAWLKIPSINYSDWGVDFQFWKINRLRTKFDQVSNSPIVKTGFLQTRQKIYTAITKEITETLNVRVSYEHDQDSFSDDLVPIEAKNTISTEGLPPTTRFHLIGAQLDYGDLIDSGSQQVGMKASLSLKAALSQQSNFQNFFLGEFNFLLHKPVTNRTRLAFRFESGLTNTDILQYWYYLGGLNKIRGFADNRFAGRYYWLINAELRHSFLEKESFTVQAVTFTDLTTTAERIQTFSSLQAASVGAGVRLILPKLYRFILRLDYAKPIKRTDDNILSFGVQQFF
jgi:outer membrane protein assembly factor BamA